MHPSLQHQIRNQVAVIIGGIETNNYDPVKRAARQIDALCYHLDALVIAEELERTQ